MHDGERSSFPSLFPRVLLGFFLITLDFIYSLSLKSHMEILGRVIRRHEESTQDSMLNEQGGGDGNCYG